MNKHFLFFITVFILNTFFLHNLIGQTLNILANNESSGNHTLKVIVKINDKEELRDDAEYWDLAGEAPEPVFLILKDISNQEILAFSLIDIDLFEEYYKEDGCRYYQKEFHLQYNFDYLCENDEIIENNTIALRLQLLSGDDLVSPTTFTIPIASYNMCLFGMGPCQYVDNCILYNQIDVNNIDPCSGENWYHGIDRKNSLSNTDLIKPTIFPNPFKNHLLVEIFPERFEIIEIFNNSGVIVYSSNTNKSTNIISVNTSNWYPGIYFIRMTNSESSQTTKIIKN